MAPPEHTSDLTGLLLIYRLRKDERLSWPSWLTCSGQLTHTVVTRRLQAEHRTGSVRRPKTGVLQTVQRNQLVRKRLSRTVRWAQYDDETLCITVLHLRMAVLAMSKMSVSQYVCLSVCL